MAVKVYDVMRRLESEGWVLARKGTDSHRVYVPYKNIAKVAGWK